MTSGMGSNPFLPFNTFTTSGTTTITVNGSGGAFPAAAFGTFTFQGQMFHVMNYSMASRIDGTTRITIEAVATNAVWGIVCPVVKLLVGKDGDIFGITTDGVFTRGEEL